MRNNRIRRIGFRNQHCALVADFEPMLRADGQNLLQQYRPAPDMPGASLERRLTGANPPCPLLAGEAAPVTGFGCRQVQACRSEPLCGSGAIAVFKESYAVRRPSVASAKNHI